LAITTAIKGLFLNIPYIKLYRLITISLLPPTLLFISLLSSNLSLAAPDTGSAEALRSKYVSLGEKLKHNQFQRPLFLDSTESPSTLKGDIYAVVDHPFATVNTALNDPDNWCDVLIQHVNTKYCHASNQAKTSAMLSVNIGKKTEQALSDAYRVEFDYKVMTSTPDYFEIELEAEQGPLSTKNYHISLEAVAIDGNRTFLHLTYSYSYGLAGRLAMKTYLATIARDKVGFTITGKQNSTEPAYVDGVRGVVERNTMRYYLAIDAYLGALATPAANQLDERLQRWFASTERYARQLHEVEWDEYVIMKRNEYKRQQTAQ